MSEKKLAVKVATGAWGSEEAVGATDGVLYLSQDLPPGVPDWMGVPEIGVASERVTVYDHDYSWVNKPTDFLVAALDAEEDGIFSWPGVWVKGVEMTFPIDDLARVTWHLVCAQPIIDGAVNGQTEMDAVGYLTQSKRVVMHRSGSVFRLNAQSGSALASTTDDTCINSVTLSIMRSNLNVFCYGSDETAFPRSNEFPEVSLTVEFAEREDGALPDTQGLIDAAVAGTLLKGDLMAKGALISDDEYYEIFAEFPALRVDPSFRFGYDAPNVNPLTVPFKVTGTDSAPSGMTATDYLGLRIRNTDSTDYA